MLLQVILPSYRKGLTRYFKESALEGIKKRFKVWSEIGRLPLL
jgi:hypothetical protein